jgi:hypothetical protein
MEKRYYFAITNKKNIDTVKNFTLNDFIYFGDVIDSLRANIVFDFGIFYEIFGDVYENADEIRKLGTPLFTNEEVQKEFNAYVVSKEAVACAIEYQRKKVIDSFKSLLVDDEKKTKAEKMEEAIQSKISEWGAYTRPYNLDVNIFKLVNSYSYEYTIFDLVRLYKSIDWENACLIFYGY